MTKFQKQMLTIAAAGALTAVTALPAMAFENEFHGMMAVKTYLGNFDASGLQFTKGTKANNYTDQRTRIQYIAKASDDLKLVTQFEMNTQWGVAYKAKSTGEPESAGGDVDTDGANFLVKHAYLDFNIGKSVNVKAGQMAYKDLLGGLYLDADMPMAQVAFKSGGYKLNLGYSRFNDNASGVNDATYLGDLASDLYLVENTFAFSKDTAMSLVYYLNADNSGKTTTTYASAPFDPKTGLSVTSTSTTAVTNKKVNTFGLSGKTKLGGLSLSGMAAYQAGYQHVGAARTSFHGWAANVLAKMAVGSGTARTGFLFTSGNNNTGSAHNRGWQTVSQNGSAVTQNSYNESGMMLLVRNTSMGGTSTDNYFRKPITNIALAHMGYDAKLTDKMYMNGNVGFAWIPASEQGAKNLDTNKYNGSDFMGTEINLEAGYKLYKNLTLKAQAATVILGGAYKNTGVDSAGKAADPDMPWVTRLGAHYSF